ncbi:MAG: hypothetical protein AAF004_15085 [Pseudomonadota bacterium]
MRIREHHSLQQLLDDTLTRRCPHCDVFAHMGIQSAPSWQSLITQRPSRLGIVAVCPACSIPVFFLSDPLRYDDDFIELEGSLNPVVRARERMELHLLPASLRDIVDEALGCMADGHHQAFALLAHRVATLTAKELGGNGKLALFNAVTDAAEMAHIDKPVLRLCRHILFDLDEDDDVPALSDHHANVLLALMRDFLNQMYVRSGHLQKAARTAQPKRH